MKEEIVDKIIQIKEQMEPEDFYTISWALFDRLQEAKRDVEKHKCRKCWEENAPPRSDYDISNRRAWDRLRKLQQANSLFHECHNWDEDFMNGTGIYAKKEG